MFSLLSYNILFGKRLDKIIHWLKKESQSDMMCFQEFPEEKIDYFMRSFKNNGFNYQFTPGFIKDHQVFGQLTAFNTHQFKLLQSQRIDLGRSRFENRLFKIKAARSSLFTVFKNRRDKQFLIANTHLTCIASNKHRLKQLTKLVSTIPKNIASSIILGDFNYYSVISKKKLFHFMKKHTFNHATHKMKTHRLFFLKHQLDYIFYRNIHLRTVEVKNVKFSDHYPIAATFSQDFR